MFLTEPTPVTGSFAGLSLLAQPTHQSQLGHPERSDTGYAMDLHNVINNLISRAGASDWLNQRDGIFMLRTDQIPMLPDPAGISRRVILDDKTGTLAEHASRLSKQPIRLPGFTPALAVAQDPNRPPFCRNQAISLWITTWVDSVRMGRNMSSTCNQANTPRAHGSTLLPIRSLDFWSLKLEAAARGP